jgi:hypothetical protein
MAGIASLVLVDRQQEGESFAPLHGHGPAADGLPEGGGIDIVRDDRLQGAAVEMPPAQVGVDLADGGQVVEGLAAVAAQDIHVLQFRMAAHTLQPVVGERALAGQHQGLQAGEQGMGHGTGLPACLPEDDLLLLLDFEGEDQAKARQ